MVQLDYDEELEPLHGMFGSMEAESEVQRTIRRAELTAFLCLLERVKGPDKVHVDNKGIFKGYGEEKRKGIDSKAGDADLWTKIVTSGDVEKDIGGSGACQGAPHKEG